VAPPPISGKAGEPVEEAVLRPEDDGRAQDDGTRKGRPRAGLAFGLAAGIGGRAAGIGANGRHLDEDTRPRRPGALGGGFRAEGMDGIEALGSGGIEHAGQVDHRISPVAGRRQRRRVADIGLHRHDLARHAEGLEVAGQIGAAAGCPDAIAPLGQRPDDVAAKKAGAADDGDELFRVLLVHEHGIQ
jgi:hypothetical protein